MPDHSNGRRNFIQSLEKGFSLLESFSQLGPQVSLSELARAVGMNLGTATRYVQTLADLGYLIRDSATKKYRLAPRVFSFGFSLLRDMDLRTRVTPFLAETTSEFEVDSVCVILDETEIVSVERMRSRALVRIDMTVGSRLPAYCTALGRAILAFLDPESLERIVDKIRMERHTPFTITNKEDLYRELEMTRQRGYAINFQELVIGQSVMAAPVFRMGVVEGSFGFSTAHHVMEDEAFRSALVARMVEISRKVSIA